MLLFGIILVVPRLQTLITAAGAPAAAWAGRAFPGLEHGGVLSQGLLGSLLGLVWSPCVGPTLGAASLLAAQGRNLGQVAGVMLAFGLGAAAPLVAVGVLTGEAARHSRRRYRTVATRGKLILGIALVAMGLLITSGLDRRLEATLVQASPTWLTRATTYF